MIKGLFILRFLDPGLTLTHLTDISVYWETSYNSPVAFICKNVSPGASVTPGVRILSHPPVPEISVKWASFLPYKRIWVG